eukprot:TRINITY_DN6783_c0_g1_i2.p1 TRINITY_DN6783_c0_g1~~TRINITY_DN6783_c0_g1_i2.p1  ORF type:complete len:1500 (+),score=264.75 TRINITY_DN6783_c0_g1_i2:50-4549(+)
MKQTLLATFVQALSLFCFLANLSPSHAARVVSKYVDKKSILMDDINSIEVVVFTLETDTPVYYNGTLLSKISEYDSRPMVTCWNQYECACVPPVVNNLYGSFSLQCGDENYGSYPYVPVFCDDEFFDDLPIPYHVVPLPPSKDPLRSLWSSVGILDSLPDGVDNQISIALFTKFYDMGSQLIRRQFPSDFDYSQCVLTVKDSLHDESGNSFSGDYKDFSQPSYDCEYLKMNELALEMESVIAGIAEVSAWSSLNMQRWKVPLLFSSNAWVGCQETITSRLLGSIQPVSFATSLCQYPPESDSWLEDPCCNLKLQYEQCCIASDVSLSVPEYDQVNDGATSTCKDPISSLGVFEDILEQLQQVMSPQSSCTAGRKEVVDDQVYESSLRFLDECQARVYGSDEAFPTCNKNDDCYTRCRDGECDIFLDDWDDTYLKCYLERMDDSVKIYLKRLWGLPSTSSDDALKSSFLQNLTDVNCIGVNSIMLTGSGLDYSLISEDHCLAFEVCNMNDDLSREECNKDPNNYICASCNGNQCQPFTLHETCYIPIPNPDPGFCEFLGGTYDPESYLHPCVLNITRTECLPPEICPLPENGSGYCRSDFCYLPAVDEANCNNQNWQCDSDSQTYDPFKFWSPSMASGNGLCILSAGNYEECEAYNGIYHFGRDWQDALYNSEEKCTTVCSIGDVNYVGSSQEECAELEVCDTLNVACNSFNSRSLCYGMIPYCDCIEIGGDYDEELGCVVYTGYDQCPHPDLTYESCSDLTNDECFDCINNDVNCKVHQQHLECQLSRSSRSSEAECTKDGAGRCNSNFIYNVKNPDCVSFFASDYETQYNTNCYYSCFFDFDINDDGIATCGGERYISAIGCQDRSVFDQGTCTELGGRWLHNPFSKEQCELEKGCYDGDDSVLLSGKDIQECQTCGKEYRSRMNWVDSNWVRGGYLKYLSWRAQEYVPYNLFKPTLNFKRVYTTINEQVASRYAPYFQTELLCRYSPLLESMRYLICDCTSDPMAPSNCYSSSVRVISAGIQRFCAGLQDWIRTGSFELVIKKDSVPVEYNCLDAVISIAPATQFRRQISDSVSSDQLTGAANQELKNPYAVISYDGGYVGQIVSDGLILDFAGRLDAVNICITRRQDISISREFSLPDIVLRPQNETVFLPLRVNMNITGNLYCATIDVNGESKATIFAARLYPDWDSRGADDEDRTFFYVVAALDYLLALISVIQICGVIYSDLFVTRKLDITVQKLLHFHILIFTVVRATYILLVAADDIEEGSLQQVLLYDLPTLLFFSAYSCLLFFWAEITSNTKIMKDNLVFVQYLRPLLIRTNAIMYTYFTIVVIISQAATNSVDMDHVRSAYYYFLAAIALGMSLGFVHYGRKLWATMTSIKVTERTARQKATLAKIAVVTVVCTASFLFQCVYLVVSLYVDITDANVALVPFLLAEFLPCALMLFSFRNPVKARLGSSATRTNSSFINRLKQGFKFSRSNKTTQAEALASVGITEMEL